jgi:hypothetical protein
MARRRAFGGRHAGAARPVAAERKGARETGRVSIRVDRQGVDRRLLGETVVAAAER